MESRKKGLSKRSGRRATLRSNTREPEADECRISSSNEIDACLHDWTEAVSLHISSHSVNQPALPGVRALERKRASRRITLEGASGAEERRLHSRRLLVVGDFSRDLFSLSL